MTSDLMKAADELARQMDLIEKEAARGIEWGEEDPIRMLDWFDTEWVNALTAYLTARESAGEVKVKPLVWIGDNYSEGIFWSATTEFGQYQVRESEVSGIYMQWDGFCMGVLGKGFDTSDEAKAAAQADYETRIRSALVQEEKG